MNISYPQIQEANAATVMTKALVDLGHILEYLRGELDTKPKRFDEVFSALGSSSEETDIIHQLLARVREERAEMDRLKFNLRKVTREI